MKIRDTPINCTLVTKFQCEKNIKQIISRSVNYYFVEIDIKINYTFTEKAANGSIDASVKNIKYKEM